MRREVGPMVIVHDANCQEAPKGLAIPARTAYEAHPNAIVHGCFDNSVVNRNLDVLIQREEFEPHRYEPSDRFPEYAVRPLCVICAGTYGPGHEEQAQQISPAGLPQRISPR
ncbi:hypothetical protein ACQPZJ_01870 [Actinoplanes sp. CA-054009]